eukprot:12457187-Heterocapsa_arctica.AAC.1
MQLSTCSTTTRRRHGGARVERCGFDGGQLSGIALHRLATMPKGPLVEKLHCTGATPWQDSHVGGSSDGGRPT